MSQQVFTTILHVCLLILISAAMFECGDVICGDQVELTTKCSTTVIEHVAENTEVFDGTDLVSSIVLSNSLSDNFADHFMIENQRIIRTKGNFDREEMVSLNTASDPVIFTFSIYHLVANEVNHLELNISVIDIDDNTPVFYINNELVIDTYHYETPESNDPKQLISLQARDFDEGINGTQEYMLGEGSSPLFNITINLVMGGLPTVSLESIGILDREEQDQHFIYIIAKEGTSVPDTAMLNISITILDADDNAPLFPISEYFQVVSENTSANTEVVKVTAQDADVGTNSEINYEINELCSKITSTSTCKSVDKPWPFAIDMESGVVSLIEMLNYEDAVNYKITIIAKNPNNPNGGTSNAIVTVDVQDINDHAPEIHSFITSGGDLSEKSKIGSLVATFMVEDNDSDEFSVYELKLLDQSTMEISTTFGLDGGTNIVLLEDVDREEKDIYELEIVATDSLNTSLFTIHQFTIQIGDDNDHYPMFVPVTNPYPLLEGSSVNTLVLQFNVTDEDIGINAQIRFFLPPNSDNFPYQDMFSLGATNGKLHVKEIPDREATPELFIKVQANDEDGEGFLAELILNITITDTNDNSPFFTTTILPSLQVKENVTIGSVLLDVDASDSDIGTNAELTFSLSSSSENLPLSINSVSGVIKLNDSLDHETKKQYTVTITVTDGETTPAMKSFSLIVLDVNDNNPYFPQVTYYKSLYENATIGTQVVTVEATDADSAEFTQLSYSFANGFDHAHFSLHSQTGSITTAELLDWEYKSSYIFEVVANDGNGRISLVNANITVIVTDVNDEIPQFTNEPYIFYVQEDVETDAKVGEVSTTSKEKGDHGSAVYSIINTEPVPFSIHPETGDITVNGQLDREERDSYELIIKVDDLAPPVNENTTKASIVVTDINDNSPVFQHDLVTIELSELQAVNSGFYTAIATDSDLYPFNVTVYLLKDSQQQFQIDSSTGVLSLTSSLNYEIQRSVLVDITATDELKPDTFIDLMQLNITVLDDNNTNITFPNDFPLYYHVNENVVNGEILLNFTAQDSKGNPQLHLNYYISHIGGGVSSDFGIDVESTSGYALLTTANELDRETQSSYSLNITITDHNIPPNSVTQFLTVYISDINDNPPSFTEAPYIFMFEEEQSGKIEIGKIIANDPDLGENGTITFSLLQSSELFSIDQSTGVLRQLQALDREATSTHSVTVVASDGGDPTKMASTIVTINVLDVNDHCPSFSPTHITVEENVQLGTVVTTILGNDTDTGPNGEVFFYRDEEKESTATDHFLLLQNGTVLVIKVPDYEQQTSFIYYIKVSDNGSPKCEKMGNLTIEIKDLNDNPPVFSGTDEYYTVEVSEAESKGYEILTIEAIDEDTGLAGDVRYGIESTADQVLFEIGVDSGVFKSNGLLDYETATQHIITVLAYDNGKPRNWVSRQNITINVVNEDDNNPKFDINPYSFVVQENQVVGTLVGTLRAHDRDIDSDSELTYKVSQIMPEGNSFTVSQTQEYAHITTLAKLDYELHFSYLLELTVVSKQKEAKTLIQIYVDNLNDEKPSFSTSQYTTSLSESSTVGSSILFVIATDADNNTNDAVSYSISNGNDDNKFDIDSSTGELMLNGELDYETKTSYTLVVMATDTGFPSQSASSTVIVTVINENEHTPVFSSAKYSFIVTEEEDDVITVGHVTATDSDAGSYGEVAYSFQLPSNQFTIDSSSGTIKTKSSIDREVTPVLDDLVVIATDTIKSSTVVVSITVTDINDNPPLFSNLLYQLSIPYDQYPGVPFNTVTSTDLDLPENSNTEYSLIEATPFVVNSTTGNLYLSSTLPSDYKPSYKFTMVATDTSNNVFSSEAIIEVFTYTDTNHPPLFEQLLYTVNVTEEDTHSNTEIVTVKATDNDGDSLTYSLKNDYQKFSIDSNGVISLADTLDYEEVSLYELTVYAADTTPSEPRTASSTVIVSVINVNDISPQFDEPPSTITLSPVPFLDVQLFQLTATDTDSPSFSFSLISQTNKFAIDSESGIVTNLIVLEDGTTYTLNFVVSDGTHSQDTNIEVSIISSPSNTPTFTLESVEFPVSEGESIGFIVHTFTSINPSEYNIVCCDSSSDVFKIDSSSGVLSLKSELDYETMTEYNLVVEARDQTDNIIRPDYQKVHINVTNVNEYAPTFIGNADKTVNEGLSDKSLISQVQAEDNDDGAYGDITFTIIQGNINDTFEIQSSGAIKLSAGKTLDRETVEVYELLVKAADGGGKLSSSTVTITILDLNDTPPTYSSNFTVGVYETSPTGVRVTQVTAYDADSSSQLGYSLGIVESYLGSVYVGVATNMFKINSTTAVITLNGELDRETVDRYVVQVSTTDSNTNTMTFLEIQVLDVNDNPPIFNPQDYSTMIPELSTLGSVLNVMISATDKDSQMNGIIRYALGNDWPKGKFIIDEMSGRIRVNGPLPFFGNCSKIDSFTSTVIATDGYHNASTTVTIKIEDVNDHAPTFIGSLYFLSVSETAEVDEVIAILTIEDNDCFVNADIQTSFPSYYHYPSDLFKFEKNYNTDKYELKVKAPLLQGVYHFRIQAYNSLSIPDGYYQAGFGTFAVTVLPENVHIPNFESTDYHFEVFEDSSLSNVIGFVEAKDVDLGESGYVTYSLKNDSVPFSIIKDTGYILVDGYLDYESVTEYTFVAIATDGGYPAKNSSVTIIISIKDVNDNSPIFSESVIKIKVTENTKNGTYLMTIAVNDNDTVVSNNIMFSIDTTTGDRAVPFTITHNTGELYTFGTIDYEETQTHEFIVSVTDLDLPSQVSTSTVIVDVNGVNEYLPVFTSSQTFVVLIDQQRGDFIGDVVARDNDGGLDGILTYSFSILPQPNYFTILSNGSIYLSDDFISNSVTTGDDRRKRNTREVEVMAEVEVKDGGLPPSSAKTNITIKIPNELVAPINDTESSGLSLTIIGVIGGSVALLIILLLIVLIVGSILYKNKSKKKNNKFQLQAENPHRSSTRLSTTGTAVTEVELQHYISRDGTENTYVETEINTDRQNTNNESESPDAAGYRRSSPHTRSTSDLASSVATDTLNLTQEGGFQYSKAQIEQIYATNMNLLTDHSQDSVHMFGSEGGGEAEGDEMDDMMFAKYDLELEGHDDISYCGKSRHSLISESSEGVREEYQFSQSTNPWSSRHSVIADRSMNELVSETGSRPVMYHFESSQPGPGIFGASTQGSTVSLTRSYHNRNKYGSERDIHHHQQYPPPSTHHHHHHPPHPSHPPHIQRYEYYPEVPHPHRYGSPIMEYRSDSNKPHEPPPPPYLSQDPYLPGHHYYHHMDSRISPDPNRSVPQYENLLSTSSTSLSTNASHSRGRPFPLARERYH